VTIATELSFVGSSLVVKIPIEGVWKPKANQFVSVDAIPAPRTGKIDLRGIKALAASLASQVPAEI
jgi:hypothetical protein